MVKVFVGNLSGSSITERELRETFEQVGAVTDCVVMARGGFGFVHMENKEDANTAINTLNGTEVCGTKLSVEMSRPRRGDDSDVKIFIGNLDKDKVTNNDLESAFSKYGSVTEAVVVEKYGFVHMSCRDEAKIAIGRLHKTNINGCLIDVALSTGENRRGGGDRGGRDRYGGGGGGRDYGGRYDRRDDRGRRDSYYDDYRGGGGGYDRRGPPPRDNYYRDRYDSRDDRYGRGPPPPPRGRDPYYDPRDSYYAPPSGRDPYGYPPPRDSYADYDRGAPPRRDDYPPPAPMSSDPYSRRDDYGPSRSDDSYGRRPPPKQENFAEDTYSSMSRAGGSGSLYNSLTASSSSVGEYPGEKRPMPPGSGGGSGYPPPAKRSYGGQDLLGSYGY
ncbi:uncharacterized protein LOC142345848 [Convolutriloba macropyga]|uniref:uncharacterized protein LOC142345848 n=1 Tax=Convolutriloba macropyga TaxID=536237 RepID=UPI003F527ACA